MLLVYYSNYIYYILYCNINIEFVMFFGWFTLGCLSINEARSIIENLVELGINVPDFLIKGLEITEKKFTRVVENNIEKENEKANK